MSSAAELRRLRMVKEQLVRRGIRDEAVLQAMTEVPRHEFIQGQFAQFAYEDAPLPIQEKQTISQPYIVARMAELLQLKASDKVLDVGVGSGYAAAVMSRIVAQVYAIERHAQLAQQAAENLTALGYNNVLVRQGDGTLGWSEYAPYDAIMVAAGGPDVPAALLAQLALNGRLVMPVGKQPRLQKLRFVQQVAPNKYQQYDLEEVRFVPLVGAEGWDVAEAQINKEKQENEE